MARIRVIRVIRGQKEAKAGGTISVIRAISGLPRVRGWGNKQKSD